MGVKVIVKGDVDRAKRRLEEGGGCKEVIESGKFPAARISNQHADVGTKYVRAIDKIRKHVHSRPEHVEAGFKTKSDYDRHFGTIKERTKAAQKHVNPGKNGMKLKGRIPGTTFRRRCREAGGQEVLQDQKEARKLFKDCRW